MANNKRGQKKKSRKEVSAYKNLVKCGIPPQEGTVAVDNYNLRGSGDIDSSDELSMSKPKIPVWYRVKKFIKGHVFESIILTLLCAFLVWGAGTIIELKVNIAIIETRVEYIDQKIEGLDSNFAAKDIIDLQLDAVKEELSNTFNLKIAEINSQLDLIEQQLEYVEKNNTGNT